MRAPARREANRLVIRAPVSSIAPERLASAPSNASLAFASICRVKLGHLRIVQEVPHEGLHPRRAVPHELHEFLGFTFKLLAVPFRQQFRVDFDGAQRFLQVVACRKSKLLKIPVGTAKFVLNAFLLVDIRVGTKPFRDGSALALDWDSASDEPTPALLVLVPKTVLEVVLCS